MLLIPVACVAALALLNVWKAPKFACVLALPKNSVPMFACVVALFKTIVPRFA